MRGTYWLRHAYTALPHNMHCAAFAPLFTIEPHSVPASQSSHQHLLSLAFTPALSIAIMNIHYICHLLIASMHPAKEALGILSLHLAVTAFPQHQSTAPQIRLFTSD